MSTDDAPPTHGTAPDSSSSGSQNGRRSHPPIARSIFSVPTPIKQLFDRFPLLTYPVNELPLSAPSHRHENVLHVFATEDAVKVGGASFNPKCLRWQAYLKFSAMPFRIVSSNNHASPSGALPFLIPGSSDDDQGLKNAKPVPSSKLQRWCMDKAGDGKIEESDDMRYEAYLSLLDLRIRRAWLYTIYLSANVTTLAEPLYILPASSNPLVRLTIARELRRAAEAELLKHSAVINEEVLYREANEAFAALETLLGADTWFFGNEKPGLFDASVFAYTHLLLDDNLGKGWIDTRLGDMVRCKGKLVGHRERIFKGYFSES